MARVSTIRLVVTDLDGTYVPIGSHTPSSANRKAMGALHAAGVTVAAATARPYEMARPLFAGLGLTGPSIFDGGASIRDVETGELLWGEWLELPRLREIAGVLLRQAKTVDFFPEFRMLPAETVSVDLVARPAPYAWALVNEAAWPEMKQQLEAIPNLNIHPGVGSPDDPGYIDVQITDIHADKFHALTELREVLGVAPEQTMAIGDSSNDMPLFENAGLKIAMGNAIPGLKVAADYVVGDVAQDGWAEAMNRFVLA